MRTNQEQQTGFVVMVPDCHLSIKYVNDLFQAYLDFDVTLPVDKVQGFADTLVRKLNEVSARLKKIFLVEDLVDSLKFAAGWQIYF